MLCWKKIFITGGLLDLLIWTLIHHFNIKKVLCKLLLMCLIYGSFHFLGTTRSPHPNFFERHLKIHLSKRSSSIEWTSNRQVKYYWLSLAAKTFVLKLKKNILFIHGFLEVWSISAWESDIRLSKTGALSLMILRGDFTRFKWF